MQVAHRFESEIVDPDNYNTALDPDVKQDYLNCLFHRLPGLDKVRSDQIRSDQIRDQRIVVLPDRILPYLIVSDLKGGEIVGFSSMYTVNQDDVHPMIGETKVRTCTCTTHHTPCTTHHAPCTTHHAPCTGWRPVGMQWLLRPWLQASPSRGLPRRTADQRRQDGRVGDFGAPPP